MLRWIFQVQATELEVAVPVFSASFRLLVAHLDSIVGGALSRRVLTKR